MSVLSVSDLRVTYGTRAGPVRAVKGVSFAIAPGRLLSIVGESGSGKSSLALAVLGALGDEAAVAGEVRYRGQDLLGMSARALRRLWGRRLAMVFQDPGGTLNPVLPVGEPVVEVLREHEGLGRAAARSRMLKLLDAVNLPDPPTLARRYPHQLSGGQQQRVSIAIALACNPDVLILDEPTTGLDVTTEARILDLVANLRERSGAAILYITHNLGVVARLGDEVAVMYAGEVVEQGPVRSVFGRPRHPYTLALMECLPAWSAAPPRVSCRRSRASCPTRPTRRPAASSPLAAGWRSRAAGKSGRRSWPSRRSGVRAASSLTRCRFRTAAATSARSCDGGSGHCRPEPPRHQGSSSTTTGARASGVLAPAPGAPRALDGVAFRWPVARRSRSWGERIGQDDAGALLVGLIEADGGLDAVRRRGVPAPGVELAPRPAPAYPDGVPESRPNTERAPDYPRCGGAPLELFGLADGVSRRARAGELLRAVGLGERYLDLYPGQVSGGERQRVAIARGSLASPDLVVCDEPTSALDVSVQATVLNLLVELQRQARTSYVFISHDLSVVRHIADHVIVLYRGRVCEAGPAEAVFAPPCHPYTEALLSAVPSVAEVSRTSGLRLDVTRPETGTGCPFHTRCPRKLGPVCEETPPPLVAVPGGHALACHIPRDELARVQTSAGPVFAQPA